MSAQDYAAYEPPLPEELEGKVATLRSIPMLPDSNPDGDIFGGWIMSQMDVAGASRAYQVVRGRVVTVAVEAMAFHKPIFIWDEVSFYTEVAKMGTTSITIKIESWALRRREDSYIKVTEGLYTYVHIDENRQPIPISLRS